MGWQRDCRLSCGVSTLGTLLPNKLKTLEGGGSIRSHNAGATRESPSFEIAPQRESLAKKPGYGRELAGARILLRATGLWPVEDVFAS